MTAPGQSPAHHDVAAGVTVVEARTVLGKAGVVVGRDAVLVIDAGIDRDEGEGIARIARTYGRPRLLLTLTHAHSDHAHGAVAFAGCEVIAHRAAARALRSEAARIGTPPADAPAVTIGLDGSAELDLGGRTVQLLDTPGHAPGSICAYVPDVGVLFGGDTIVTSIPPAFSDGDPQPFERSLRRLAQLGPRVVVPGHGPVLPDGRTARRWLLAMAGYMAEMREVAFRPDRSPCSPAAWPPLSETTLGALLPDTSEVHLRHADNLRDAFHRASVDRP